MAKMTPWFYPRFTDNNGKVLSRGLVYTYSAGTSTPKSTYTDSAGGTANSNPTVLNAGGMNHIWLGDGAYKIIVTDGSGAVLFDASSIEGNTIWTADNINGTGAGDDTIQVVASMAALKALTTLSGAAVVKGYYAGLDSGGGTFYYDSSSSDADNAGTIIIPDSAPATGRWIRLFSGPIDIRWFGAKGDGTTDDSSAIAAADTFAYGYNKSTIAYAGTYLMNSDPTLTVPMELKTNAVLKSTGLSYSITPIIDISDETRHFNYSGGTITFPATASIKNIWLDGSTTGWYQYHFPTNALNTVVIINDNAGSWVSGNVSAIVNGTVYTQIGSGVKDTDMAALAAKIQAHGSVLTAVYSSTAHTITITPEIGRSVDVTIDYSALTGGSQMTLSIENKSAHSISTAQRLTTRQGANVASENNLTLGNDGNVFVITGTTQINLIASTNWPAGSEITMIFQDALLIKNNQAASTEWKPIILANGADKTTAAGEVYKFVYDSQTPSWRELVVYSDITMTGNLTLATVTKGIKIKEGTNATMGTTTLSGGGTATVSTSAVTANSRIFLTTFYSGGTGSLYAPYITAKNAGVSFSIYGPPSQPVDWLIVNPA